MALAVQRLVDAEVENRMFLGKVDTGAIVADLAKAIEAVIERAATNTVDRITESAESIDP